VGFRFLLPLPVEEVGIAQDGTNKGLGRPRFLWQRKGLIANSRHRKRRPDARWPAPKLVTTSGSGRDLGSHTNGRRVDEPGASRARDR
jgi:hypothetical protein